ncbi:competence/damage-inducible protein CinA-like protein [Galbibacter orientalis DSM 19592]|uniref:CinA-like protein n=1 Tax=Galbibacter orientalis DSM 19592 TaxID=926559 RepID=I3C7G8_9FLAO|nr:competence/damage-inducible protein A [Galbibacter orientalis]EIJ39561.1 competence/damage-inducible protein CinA-like protein [Galbibacter orientalis DSM 19592]
MFAEIITIGDEILIGQIIDTNSAFIAKQLNLIGVSVYQITSIQDDKKHILEALKEAEERADIIIITGGLGPTKDDITKHTICEYFDDELVEDATVLAHVEHLFKKYISTPISDLNRKQALVPSKARVLKNNFGTAPGMWLEKGSKTFISLPGVPYEMEALITGAVIPNIQEKYERPYILHKTIITYGLGESALAERIEAWEDNLPPFIRLAYLPNLGKVRLRLTAKGTDKDILDSEVKSQIEKLNPLINDIFFGMEEDSVLEIVAGKLLKQNNETVATAESCTGGKIAETFTAIPGSSAYFKGSVVSYATQAKIDVLHVDKALVERHSVVSKQVAEAMALSAQKLFKSTYAIATTGNAGPTKGDSNAEVGTVFIAIATPKGVISEEFNFGNHREKVINKAVNKAFEILCKEILKK